MVGENMSGVEIKPQNFSDACNYIAYLSLSGKTEDILSVLEQNPDSSSSCIDAALSWAAIGGDVDTVKLLLERRADPNAIILKGKSALEFATLCEHIDVVILLLEYNASQVIDVLLYLVKNGRFIDVSVILTNIPDKYIDNFNRGELREIELIIEQNIDKLDISFNTLGKCVDPKKASLIATQRQISSRINNKYTR